jgi:hypothetical protein
MSAYSSLFEGYSDLTRQRCVLRCGIQCVDRPCCVLSGLKLGGTGEEALGQKLLRLRLEALVRTGDEHTADQALESLSQVQHS